MFGISISELTIIMVVALIVIGPDKLPEIVRTVGKMVGKFRHFTDNIRSDLEKEFKIDELKRTIQNDNQLTSIKKELTNVVQETEGTIRSLERSMRQNLSDGATFLEQQPLLENDHEEIFDEINYDANFAYDHENDIEEIGVMTAPPKNYNPSYRQNQSNLPSDEVIWRKLVFERQLTFIALEDRKTPSMLVYELQRQQLQKTLLSDDERESLYIHRLIELNQQ